MRNVVTIFVVVIPQDYSTAHVEFFESRKEAEWFMDAEVEERQRPYARIIEREILFPTEQRGMVEEDKMKLDVIILNAETREIASVIGRDMKRWDGCGSGRNTADLRRQTGRERINDHYRCEFVAAGKFKSGDILPEGAEQE